MKGVEVLPGIRLIGAEKKTLANPAKTV